jgi:transposase-like protein
MSTQNCREAMSLLAESIEALRRQCELLPESHPAPGGTLDSAEEVVATTQQMSEHMMKCPICRSQ